MRVLGISCITNMTLGARAPSEVTHEDVLSVAERVGPRLATVVRGVIGSLPN
jgi:purine nucleoside phosphorylase